MSRSVTILSLALSVVLLASGSVLAGTDKQKARNESQRQKQHARLLELRAAIDANGGSRMDQIEEYLTTALNLVYLAKARAHYDFSSEIERSNTDLTTLVEMGYLPEWPGNPFNDWQPMRVLSTTDSFSSGDIVLEVCPASEYTSLGNKRYLGSFNLYIYGFEGRGRSPESVSTGINREWSKVPADTFYSLSFNMRSDAQAERDAKLLKQQGPENFKPAAQ